MQGESCIEGIARMTLFHNITFDPYELGQTSHLVACNRHTWLLLSIAVASVVGVSWHTRTWAMATLQEGTMRLQDDPPPPAGHGVRLFFCIAASSWHVSAQNSARFIIQHQPMPLPP